MNSECQYALSDNILLIQEGSDLVLFNQANGAHYGLDRTGSDLIKAIQDNQPVARIVRQIAERYQLDYPSVDSEVEELITQLLDQKVLRETMRPSS